MNETGAEVLEAVRKTRPSLVLMAFCLAALPLAVSLERARAENVPFAEKTISTAADYARLVFAADVDGDGDMDVLSASENDDKIAWYESDGGYPPSFTERVISTAADGAASVFAADLDGDGDTDVLSASWFDNKIAWYENNGGSPPSFTERAISTGAILATSVFGADVDGDGDVDALSASDYEHKIAWYENNGGSPPSFTTRVISTSADGAQSVFAADVDGDGDVDVLSASAWDNKIAWYENNGGSPPSFTTRAISTSAQVAWSVFAADVDGDGDIDALSASSQDNKIAWYENNGGSPPSFTTRVISTNAKTAHSVFAADVDGDGDTDVLSASAYDPNIAWYENDGGYPPSFTRRVISTNAQSAHSVFAADMDRDGDTDVLSASLSDDKIAWYENTGGNALSFTERAISTNAVGAAAVFAADVDGDGDTDVLSASEYDDKVAWYESDGGHSPSFTERVISTAANGAASVFGADVDGDGDTDVLSASFVDDKIAWYENDGAADPSFTERVISTSAAVAQSVFAADVDSDGDMDVLSASSYDNKVAWYENDGGLPPSFTERAISTAADGAVSVFAADVDGDGHIDALSASVDDNKIAWYKNNGASPPSFTQRTISTDRDGPCSVFAADLDADGDVDVLSASWFDGKISLYQNDGDNPPFLTEWTISANADGARSVFAADLDGDGDMDVLSASNNDDKIAWYETKRPWEIAPASPVVTADEYIHFTTSIGTGEVWSFTSNESGGGIDQDTGLYRAGAGGAVSDIVSVAACRQCDATMVTVTSTPRPPGVVGPPTSMDVDGGGVGLSDMIFILKSVVGLETPTLEQALAADFDCNGSIGLGDVINALRIVVGLAPLL